MSANTPSPMEFIKNMWSSMGFNLPGMVTPTFDIDELDKRISELKTVEGWLSMNLSMLQMTIQGLEMQRATIAVVQTMGQMAEQTTAGIPTADPAKAAAADPSMPWPWNLMPQMQSMQQEVPTSTPPAEEAPETPPTSKSRKQPKQ